MSTLELRYTSGYEPPKVASTHPIRSSFSGDIYIQVGPGVVDVNLNLRPPRKVRLREYLDLYPKRKRESHWILEPGWAATFRPLTSTPFWFNKSGKVICLLCDGKHKFRDILSKAIESFPAEDTKQVIRDVLVFLLLLEELDLVEFRRSKS